MARQTIKTTIETIETTGKSIQLFLWEYKNTLSQKLSLLSLLSLKKCLTIPNSKLLIRYAQLTSIDIS